MEKLPDLYSMTPAPDCATCEYANEWGERCSSNGKHMDHCDNAYCDGHKIFPRTFNCDGFKPLENITDERIEHTWDYCGQCRRPFVRCGKCGNNSCNAAHGTVDNKPCDACHSAYAMQRNQTPPEFDEEYKAEQIAQNTSYWNNLFEENAVKIIKKMMIFEKEYCWEELSDLDRDISEAIDADYNTAMKDIGGEYKGKIIVTIRYEEDDNLE